MEELTAYERLLALEQMHEVSSRIEDCAECQRPWPYCLCDDEDEQTSLGALAGIWEHLR